jgi:hypothetical protein
MIIELGKVTEETQSTNIPSLEMDDGDFVRVG